MTDSYMIAIIVKLGQACYTPLTRLLISVLIYIYKFD